MRCFVHECQLSSECVALRREGPAGVLGLGDHLLGLDLLHVDGEVVGHARLGVVVLQGDLVGLEATIGGVGLGAIAERLHLGLRRAA